MLIGYARVSKADGSRGLIEAILGLIPGQGS